MARGAHKRWSQQVTDNSNALDLDEGVFSKDDPRSIARSLKRSADRSRRRKGEPFRSAMSMLTFYINRAGKKLSKARLKRLEAAKEELRDLYGRRHKTVWFVTINTDRGYRRQDMAKYGKKASKKVEKAMHERKEGTLKSGRSGKKVTSKKQAIAIGLSEARQAGAKVPPKKPSSKKK
jgi:hypothetical protein